jgi:hypothetical protein
VRNLAPSTRKLLEEPKTLPCQLDVGYEDESLHTIFLGTVRTARSVKEGTEIVTTIATGDDGHIGARPSYTAPKGASQAETIHGIAKQMGVGLGNIATVEGVQVLLGAVGDLAGVAATVFTGRGPEVFTQLLRSNGLEWSVQDGALQVLPVGQSGQVEAVLLSSRTGLVGSPSVDNKGVLSARALIQPDLVPGRPVTIDSLTLQGTFRIEEVVLRGDTFGTEWYAEIHGKKWAPQRPDIAVVDMSKTKAKTTKKAKKS